MATPITGRQKLGLWAVGLLAVSLLIHGQDISTPGLLDRSGRVKASDFMRLYVTGLLADQGRWPELFDPAAHVAAAQARIDARITMEGLHPNYGPSAAWLLRPASRLPFLLSWAVFAACSTAALLIGMWALAAQTPALRPYRAVIVLATAASPAVFETVRYRQLSAVTTLLFITAVALDGRNRPVAAGVALGLVAFKPHLVMPAGLVWLMSGHWRLLLGLTVGVGAHVALGIVVAGWKATVEWVEVLATLGRAPQLVQAFQYEQHSLWGFGRLQGLDGVPLLAAAGALSLAVLAAASHAWRVKGAFDRRWPILIVATVLVSPHLLTYDLLLLAPAIALVATSWLRTARAGSVRSWLLGAMYLAPVFSPLLAGVTNIQTSTLALLWAFGLLAWESAADRSSSISPNINS